MIHGPLNGKFFFFLPLFLGAIAPLNAQTLQTISLDAIPNQILGISPIVTAAHATSGLPVSIASTTPSVCKAASAVIALLSTGTCSIKATQAGNATYSAASPLTRSFTVAQAKASNSLNAAPGNPLPVGNQPNSIAVADFNGDGILDMAVTNSADGTVTILLANGIGGFGVPAGSPFAVGTSPRAVVAADFNGDGLSDIAVANAGDNTVTILLGNGSGGFTAAPGSPQAVGTGTQPVSLAVGDFNADGIQDLAVANAGASTVTAFLGTGTGAFRVAPGSPFVVGTSPYSIAVGDFDGDGIADLATANHGSNNVTVMRGNGSGGFSAAAGSPVALGPFNSPVALVVGDFNGDGVLDLAAASSSANNVAVLLGNGVGGFAASTGSPFSAGTNPGSLVAGDFNGDGVTDLAIADTGVNSVLVLLGNGSGGFISGIGPYTVGTGPAFIATGDFNGDGVLDLVTADAGSNNVNLLFGVPASSATSGPLRLIVTHSSEIALGSPVSTVFSASGGTPPYTWAAARLPAGVSLDPQTGILSGTPTAAGNTSASVSVLDSTGAAVTVPVTIQVLGLTTSTPLPPGTVGSSYSVALTAAGGAPPYTWSLPSSSVLPPGLTLQSGTLSGTPSAIGNFNFAIQVADAGGFATSSVFSLLVTGTTSSLQVIPGSLLSGTVGVSYAQNLTAAGGAPPYTWTLIGGTLAPGLSLTGSSGTIAGTSPVVRTSTFTALATDSAGATSSGVFSVTITPAPLTLSGLPFLTGIAGASYPAQILSGAGGVGPYTFSVSTGSLPPGLTLKNGTLSGIATTAGTYNFSVTMTDSESPAQAVTSQTQMAISSTANASLIISTGSVSFNLATGASAVPPPATVTVQSTVPFSPLTFSVVANPVVSWLDISSTGATPGSIALAIDPGALSFDVSPTPLTTSVVVSCPAGSYCAGYTQTIAVSLSVTNPAPLLTFSQNLVSFTTPVSSNTALTQTVPLTNIGGGSASITSITAADTWLTISNTPASISPGPPVNLTLTASPTGLSAGYHVTTVTVVSSAGTITIPVSLEIAAAPLLTLSNSGAQFQVVSGSVPANTGGSFQIGVNGSGSINWTATVLPGAPWLTLNEAATGSITGTGPATIGYSVAGSREQTPQAYYGTIQVTAPGVANSPLNYEVVLNVAPSGAPPVPILQPAGLVFVSAIGGSPEPQTVVVNSNSGTAVPYSASVSTTDGNAWLSLSSPTGLSSGNPTISSVSISASPGALASGVYTGTVTFQYSAVAVRSVNVTLIVEPVITPPSSCFPTQLASTPVDIMNNFSATAGWPTPVSVTLLNDCGLPATNAQVTATFSNGDAPLVLNLVNAAAGLYSGTWSPINASEQATITITSIGPLSANSTTVDTATSTISGEVLPGTAPQLTPGGTLQLYNEQVAAAIPPGSILEIYGSNLSPSPMLASTIPLLTTLGGTSVTIGGYPAPLFYVSPSQIDAELPTELTPGNSYQVVVTANGAQSTAQTVQIATAAPGIVIQPSGLTIAQHQKDNSFVTETSPAAPGENLVIYATGLGAVSNPVADGAAGSASPLSVAQTTPLVTVNGAGGSVSFAGLAPGYVALYQINFQVPPTAPNGDLSLVVSQNGVPSNAAVLPVHN